MLSYVYHRCQKQNYLLSLFVSSLSPAGQVYDSPFPIPFDQIFSEFRYRVSNINISQALQEEIDRPNPEIQLTDSKNDVAFIFSLIPVAVAFI